MRRGFTLIELLVVIAIIGILASVVIASLNSTKVRAQDTKRVEQVQEIKKALALYYVNVGTFPIHTTAITITGEDAFSTALVGQGVMPIVPADPTHPTNTYTYQSNATGGDYTITFCLVSSPIGDFTVGCTNTIKP